MVAIRPNVRREKPRLTNSRFCSSLNKAVIRSPLLNSADGIQVINFRGRCRMGSPASPHLIGVSATATIRSTQKESGMRVLPLLLTALWLFAQTPSRVATGYDSIQAPRLKADLTFLASDALEGRRSLERGSEVAIQWIASEFGKAGLKPLNGDSFLQPVPLIEFTADRALTTLVVRYGDTSQTYRAPDATANFANEVAVSGQVVF